MLSTSNADIFHTDCQSDFQFCPLHIQHTSSVLPFSPICVQAEGLVWCCYCFEQVLLEDFSSCLYNFLFGTLLSVACNEEGIWPITQDSRSGSAE